MTSFARSAPLWRLGSAWTRWGAYSSSPHSLTACIKGLSKCFCLIFTGHLKIRTTLLLLLMKLHHVENFRERRFINVGESCSKKRAKSEMLYREYDQNKEDITGVLGYVEYDLCQLLCLPQFKTQKTVNSWLAVKSMLDVSVGVAAYLCVCVCVRLR